MVVVKVRETYDLCTVKNKMTVIAVHTPNPDIIKRNFPGLLIQCKAYRPLRASVRIACASVQPLDPLGVGTTENDVAPEDVFNPILYKAMTNIGMSQLEARITALSTETVNSGDPEVAGSTATVDTDSITPYNDEFNVYYGLLANAHGWRHASPQAGLSMDGLRPMVYEMLYNVGDNREYSEASTEGFSYPDGEGNVATRYARYIRGNAKQLPFINCTSYTYNSQQGSSSRPVGFEAGFPFNAEVVVPWINCCVAGIVIPPSRLHQLFYRMVVEWDIEFSMIRPIGEVTNYEGLAGIGQNTHYQNYNYAATKMAVTGTEESILDSDSCMVSANVDVKKVM